MATLEPRPSLVLERFAPSRDRGLLRFLTIGSVDDGKSTLIGRLLYDTRLLYEDQLTALEADSRRHGTTGDDLDFALLLDGLEAEREQGITIDVAYRFFATERRTFVVADAPGHEQYTRNMATGASTADLAVLLVDARKGVLPQTLRHTYIAHLLGIRHVVLAVNKMDQVDYSRARFHEIVAEYTRVVERLSFSTVTTMPISARFGDNVTFRSAHMRWYAEPTLLAHLEEIDVQSDLRGRPFRMPVQWVNRPHQNFRGFSGTVVSGVARPGDIVVVAPGQARSRIARIVTADGDLPEAEPRDAVTLVLEDDIDVARGDLLVGVESPPEVADQFSAHILWMAEDAMMPGRSYLLKIGTSTVAVTVTDLKHKVDVNTLEWQPGKTLGLNEIGHATFYTARPIPFDSYRDIRETGAFIIIDRFTCQTVGAGMIDCALPRARNLTWQELAVDKAQRSALMRQKPVVLWFTGLCASGKSTIANLVERFLTTSGHHTYLLDGDNVRHGLNKDLGFTEADRVENIRRVGEVARLMVDAGLIVLCSFISPFRPERRTVRETLAPGEFIEIYVSTPLEVCQERDFKGLYAKARRGAIPNFTGFDSRYEPPENPDLVLDASVETPENLASRVVALLHERGIIRTYQ